MKINIKHLLSIHLTFFAHFREECILRYFNLFLNFLICFKAATFKSFAPVLKINRQEYKIIQKSLVNASTSKSTKHHGC